MQIVIDISDAQYEIILRSDENWAASCASKEAMMYAIKTGTPLPKGHGKLVDVNSIPKEDRDITVKDMLRPGTLAYVGAIDLEEYINSLPTVIEADKQTSGCSSCPHSGSIIDGHVDCPDAYTEQSQYCGLNNKE